MPAGQGVWRVWAVLESARRVWRVLEGGPTGQLPHLRWSQAPPRPSRRPGSADSLGYPHVIVFLILRFYDMYGGNCDDALSKIVKIDTYFILFCCFAVDYFLFDL